jgi:PAS domain S-box-containing protein
MPVDAGPTPEIFRLAVEASPSGMIAVNSDGTIIMINGEIERLFGYACEELLGRPVDILTPDEVRAKHVIQRSGYILRPGARRMGTGREFLGRRKDGGQFPIEIGLNSIRIDGGSWCCAPSSTSASASISSGYRTNSSSR